MPHLNPHKLSSTRLEVISAGLSQKTPKNLTVDTHTQDQEQSSYSYWTEKIAKYKKDFSNKTFETGYINQVDEIISKEIKEPNPNTDTLTYLTDGVLDSLCLKDPKYITKAKNDYTEANLEGNPYYNKMTELHNNILKYATNAHNAMEANINALLSDVSWKQIQDLKAKQAAETQVAPEITVVNAQPSAPTGIFSYFSSLWPKKTAPKKEEPAKDLFEPPAVQLISGTTTWPSPTVSAPEIPPFEQDTPPPLPPFEAVEEKPNPLNELIQKDLDSNQMVITNLDLESLNSILNNIEIAIRKDANVSNAITSIQKIIEEKNDALLIIKNSITKLTAMTLNSNKNLQDQCNAQNFEIESGLTELKRAKNRLSTLIEMKLQKEKMKVETKNENLNEIINSAQELLNNIDNGPTNPKQILEMIQKEIELKITPQDILEQIKYGHESNNNLQSILQRLKVALTTTTQQLSNQEELEKCRVLFEKIDSRILECEQNKLTLNNFELFCQDAGNTETSAPSILKR